MLIIGILTTRLSNQALTHAIIIKNWIIWAIIYSNMIMLKEI